MLCAHASSLKQMNFKMECLSSLLVIINTVMIHLLNRLRLIQNTAARIVTLSKRFDHITPILFKLHWLPLNYRIHFKILLLVYKCSKWLGTNLPIRTITLR